MILTAGPLSGSLPAQHCDHQPTFGSPQHAGLLASLVLLVYLMFLLLSALVLAASRSATASIGGSSCDDAAFESWAASHGKAYATAGEHSRRAAIFRANCEHFRQLSTVPGGATFAPDAWSDLTAEEFSATRSNGCYYDEEQGVGDVEHWQGGPVDGSEDGTVDWRDASKNPLKVVAVTPVKNQGAFGTCWSFGVAENLEGLNVRQGHALTNISEQEFISCCKDCQGRKAENSFVWLANNTGGHPALEATYKYEGSPNVTCRAKTAPRAPVMLNSWGRVADDGTGKPVVAGLHAHGPMGMGVDATCFRGYHGGIIRNCTSKGVDHAVLM